MTDHQDMLERELDRLSPPRIPLEQLARRRDRKHRDERVRAGLLGLAIAIAVVGLGIVAIRSTPPTPAVDPTRSELGIFADVRGWIAYGDPLGDDPGIWAMDPADPDVAPVLLDPDGGVPVAWSSDGSKLLIFRGATAYDLPGELLVLEADGTETHLADVGDYADGSFTPDGSQVVFAWRSGIASVDADGGSPRLLYDGDSVYASALSPDGSRLAFFEGHGDAENSLWVMNVDGTDKRQIVGEEDAGRTPWSLQWSPDGARLAFSSGGEDRSFGVVNADGSGLALVAARVPALGPAAGPYWSPDGTRLAFATGRGEFVSLVIARPDGTELQELGVGRAGPWNPLDPVPADDSVPAQTPSPGIFSGVGGWIAFESEGVLHAVAPDGSEETDLLDGRRDLWVQDWSPDGSRLLAKLDGGCCSPGDLAVIEPDGSETTLVHFDGDNDTYFEGASFSPDGATVVFARWRSSGQLWTVASDGSGEPRLLLESEDGEVSEPTYSPDGTRIAYVDGGGDHGHTIRVVSADGTDVRVLIDATGPFDAVGHIFGLEWSPDGSLIAVGLGDGPEAQGIYTVRPDGTDLRLLIPKGKNPAWSPDGSLIAYSPGVSIANADGSDHRSLAPVADLVLWNPGAPADGA